MNMKKKLVTVCLVACMAVTAVAGGTLAYFTDKTEEKINTFPVGKVDITLTEEAWDAPEADHKIMPGKTLAKDPTVTVDGESEAAWVFVEVEIGDKFNSLMDNYSGTNGKDDHEQFAAWTDGINEGWEYKGTQEGKLVYAYTTKALAANEKQTLFDNIVVPNMTSEELAKVTGDDVTLKITAKAIQTAESLTDADKAYKALYNIGE